MGDKDKDTVDQMQNDRHSINARNGGGSIEDVFFAMALINMFFF